MKWIIVALYVIGTISTVATIGKERKPISAVEGAVIVAVQLLLLTAMIIWL